LWCTTPRRNILWCDVSHRKGAEIQRTASYIRSGGRTSLPFLRQPVNAEQHLSLHDSQSSVRQVSFVFAKKESQDRKEQKPRNILFARRSQEARARRAIFQARIGRKASLEFHRPSIGTVTLFSRANSFAVSYPASAWRIMPMPGSVVSTHSIRFAIASVPSATMTCPACSE
jgi:hypothetical protein